MVDNSHKPKGYLANETQSWGLSTAGLETPMTCLHRTTGGWYCNIEFLLNFLPPSWVVNSFAFPDKIRSVSSFRGKLK